MTEYTLVAPTSTLAVLPVLNYPGLLEVRDHGREIPYLLFDHWLALDLSPGEHAIEVRFRGVAWANLFSLATWLGTIALLAVIGARRSLLFAVSWVGARRKR